MIKTEHIIIIALFGFIIYQSTCNSKTIETKIITETITRTDSVRVTDTIKEVVRVPYASTPLIEYVYIDDTLKSFKYAKNDSLLSYEITVESEIKPKNVKIKYDLTNITILDSIYIKDSVHVKEEIKKSFISMGGQIIVGKKSFGFAPQLIYIHKNGNNFGLGYDLINKNFQVKYTKRLLK